MRQPALHSFSGVRVRYTVLSCCNSCSASFGSRRFERLGGSSTASTVQPVARTVTSSVRSPVSRRGRSDAQRMRLGGRPIDADEGVQALLSLRQRMGPIAKVIAPHGSHPRRTPARPRPVRPQRDSIPAAARRWACVGVPLPGLIRASSTGRQPARHHRRTPQAALRRRRRLPIQVSPGVSNASRERSSHPSPRPVPRLLDCPKQPV
jgi:hypothetical protein